MSCHSVFKMWYYLPWAVTMVITQIDEVITRIDEVSARGQHGNKPKRSGNLLTVKTCVTKQAMGSTSEQHEQSPLQTVCNSLTYHCPSPPLPFPTRSLVLYFRNNYTIYVIFNLYWSYWSSLQLDAESRQVYVCLSAALVPGFHVKKFKSSKFAVQNNLYWNTTPLPIQMWSLRHVVFCDRFN